MGQAESGLVNYGKSSFDIDIEFSNERNRSALI